MNGKGTTPNFLKWNVMLIFRYFKRYFSFIFIYLFMLLFFSSYHLSMWAVRLFHDNKCMIFLKKKFCQFANPRHGLHSTNDLYYFVEFILSSKISVISYPFPFGGSYIKEELF